MLCVGDGGGGWFALQPDREPLQNSDGLRPMWMISKREHCCLILFPIEVMFANTIPSKYLC